MGFFAYEVLHGLDPVNYVRSILSRSDLLNIEHSPNPFYCDPLLNMAAIVFNDTEQNPRLNFLPDHLG